MIIHYNLSKKQEFFYFSHQSCCFLYILWYECIPSIVWYPVSAPFEILCWRYCPEEGRFVITPTDWVYPVPQQKQPYGDVFPENHQGIWWKQFMYHPNWWCHWKNRTELLHHQHFCLQSLFWYCHMLDCGKFTHLPKRKSSTRYSFSPYCQLYRQ